MREMDRPTDGKKRAKIIPWSEREIRIADQRRRRVGAKQQKPRNTE